MTKQLLCDHITFLAPVSHSKVWAETTGAFMMQTTEHGDNIHPDHCLTTGQGQAVFSEYKIHSARLWTHWDHHLCKVVIYSLSIEDRCKYPLEDCEAKMLRTIRIRSKPLISRQIIEQWDPAHLNLSIYWPVSQVSPHTKEVEFLIHIFPQCSPSFWLTSSSINECFAYWQIVVVSWDMTS